MPNDVLQGLLPLSGYVRFFVTLTAVLDPFLAVPIFLTLTAARGADERAALVRIVTVTVFSVLAVSALFGEQLLVLIATRLLGLLLAALAIQTMAEGLRQLFPGLA